MAKKAFDATTTAAAQLFGTGNNTPAKATETKKTTTFDTIPAAPPIDTTPKPVEQPAPVPAAMDATPFSWKARPDAERRDRRLAITCKQSIAAKAAALARERGYSLNYFFELLILDQWRKEHPDK